jgi:hypothetical protein
MVKKLQLIFYRVHKFKNGSIILKWILEKWDGGTEWITLAQDRDRWRDHANAVMNIWAPKKYGEFLDYLRSCQLLKKDSAPWSQLVNHKFKIF